MTASSRVYLILCSIFILLFYRPVLADDTKPINTVVRTKPLWELHLFNSVARLPLYRGSDEHKTYFLPLPYLIYRGKIFQADREGLRGIFYRSEYLETTFSFYGNPPADDDDTAREGIGDLDAIVEAGPALKWFFLGRHPRKYLYIAPALRWTASVGIPDNLKTRHRGYRFLASLIYHYEPTWQNNRWQFDTNLEINFADQRYHGYFYDVPPEHAHPNRPAYEAGGGFGGIMLSGSVSHRFNDKFSLVVYGRWETLAGAVYQDSPLVETDNNFIGAAALNWQLYSSKKRVDARYQEK